MLWPVLGIASVTACGEAGGETGGAAGGGAGGEGGGEAGGEGGGEVGVSKGVEEFWPVFFLALAASWRFLIALVPMKDQTEWGVEGENTANHLCNFLFCFTTSPDHFLKYYDF